VQWWVKTAISHIWGQKGTILKQKMDSFFVFLLGSIVERGSSTATFGACLHVGTMFQKLVHDSYMATSGSQM
jgi:ABC-type antimicrobial peptide transport system ATPase subunit